MKSVCEEGVAALKAIGYREDGNTIVFPKGTEPSQGFVLLGILNQLDERTARRENEIGQVSNVQILIIL